MTESDPENTGWEDRPHIAGWLDDLTSDDYPRQLRALRDRLAAELMVAEGSAVAAIGKQLGDVLGKLRDVTPKEESALDQLAAARAARLAGTPDPPAVRGKRGKRSSGASADSGAAS